MTFWKKKPIEVEPEVPPVSNAFTKFLDDASQSAPQSSWYALYMRGEENPAMMACSQAALGYTHMDAMTAIAAMIINNHSGKGDLLDHLDKYEDIERELRKRIREHYADLHAYYGCQRTKEGT